MSFKKMKMTEGAMEAYLGAVDALGTNATLSNSGGSPPDINPFVQDPESKGAAYTTTARSLRTSAPRTRL